MHPRKVAGFVVGSVGVASLVVSAVIGTKVSSEHELLTKMGCDKIGNNCTSTAADKYKNLYCYKV